jgi:hypothetical protein
MALHVDVLENRWSAGYQQRVARAWIEDGHIEVDGDEHWVRLVREVLDGAEADHPRRALATVAEHFNSDYAEALEPHDDGDCPLGDDGCIPFEAGDTPAAQAQEAARA